VYKVDCSLTSCRKRRGSEQSWSRRILAFKFHFNSKIRCLPSSPFRSLQLHLSSSWLLLSSWTLLLSPSSFSLSDSVLSPLSSTSNWTLRILNFSTPIHSTLFLYSVNEININLDQIENDEQHVCALVCAQQSTSTFSLTPQQLEPRFSLSPWSNRPMGKLFLESRRFLFPSSTLHLSIYQ